MGLRGGSGRLTRESNYSLRNLTAQEIVDMPEQRFVRLMGNPKTRKDLEHAMRLADGIDDA
jgi:hypothetical protein